VNKVCFFLSISIITSFSEEMHISRHVPFVYLAAYLPQNVSLSSCLGLQRISFLRVEEEEVHRKAQNAS
jgi:hypothetical protein